jgi:hypothetical protein
MVLKFAEQADTDPALSRTIEYWIQKSMGVNLDRSRFDVDSLKCRGKKCQISAHDRQPGAEKGWNFVVVKLLRDLNDAPILNPATGMQIGRPQVELVEQFNGQQPSWVTEIVF